MWIRSQNGCSLLKINDFINFREDGCRYSIHGEGYELGTYSSYRKASKVLDEIQGQIENYPPNKVFQMPANKDV